MYCKHMLIIIFIFLYRLTNADLFCNGIEIQYIGDQWTQIPAGVCQADKYHMSHKFECVCKDLNGNETITDLNKIIYNNSMCQSDPISIESYTEFLESQGIIDYNINCDGIPCHYGIQRIHPTTDCSMNISSVSHQMYDLDPIIIGSCMSSPSEQTSSQVTSCINGKSFEALWYLDDIDCSTNSSLILADPSLLDGFCDGNGYQYEILCGIAETFNNQDPLNCSIPSDNTTIEPQRYSLEGTWYIENARHEIIFGFQIQIDSKCEYIWFTLKSPANNTWFGIGMGGDYKYNGGKMMNGYAIISLLSEMDSIYESTMIPGETPIPQHHDDLQDCEFTERDGIRTAVCKRAYITDDTQNDDFYKFTLGANSIIWGWGDIAELSGVPLKHGRNDIGEAYVGIIYLFNQDPNDLCGYAKDYEQGIISTTQTFTTKAFAPPITTPEGTIGKDGDEVIDPELGTDGVVDDSWMIIGIVFIVLFVLVVILLILSGYYIYGIRRNKTKVKNVSYTKTGTDECEEDVVVSSVPRKMKMTHVAEHSDFETD